MTATQDRPTAPPREGLRKVDFRLTRAEEGEAGDGLTFEGYAAVFNSTTRINSWEGVFDEQVAPGAFRKSLRERTPVMQFDHGQHPFIGSMPIGTFEQLDEDEHGLAVTARMFDDPSTGLLRQGIAAGAIHGMSFRFEVIREEWRDAGGKPVKPDELMDLLWLGEQSDRGPLQRTLKELKVAELGPVVFPAYTDTTASLRARQLASQLRTDPAFARDLADALILQPPTSPATEPGQREAAPPDGHPAERDDAPPEAGHPSAQETDPQPDRFAAFAARATSRLARLERTNDGR